MALPKTHLEGNVAGEAARTRQQIRDDVVVLLRMGMDEDFSDGYVSDMARRVQALVAAQGSAAVDALASLIDEDKAPVEAVADALHWLGDLEHEPTHDACRRLLERTLLSDKALAIRDGACAGLALMGDPSTAATFRQAIENEANAAFREILEDALADDG
jgi:hypothetical protein